MAPITYLDDRRPTPTYPGLTCPCGSTWFALRHPHQGAFDGPGAVRADTHGRITSYTGHLVCVECATPTPWSAP